MKPTVTIIDYGMGNLFSIKCALDKVGLKSLITKDISKIRNSEAIILPGVGAFPDAIKKLRYLKLDKVIIDLHSRKKIIFGICLGMQLLFEKSYEGKISKGLGILKGKVVKFQTNKNFKKSFNVGWKKIQIIKNQKNKGFLNAKDNYMYFIHSFHVKPGNEQIITSKSSFNGLNFVSSVNEENVYGFQFHPEKSSKSGLNIYKCLKNIIYEKSLQLTKKSRVL
jgi:glutamine amidotransferase